MNTLSWWFLGIGIVGLWITILRAFDDEETLSQMAQRLLPRWADWLIGIGGGILLCILPVVKPVAVMWAIFWGHIWIANKERYE